MIGLITNQAAASGKRAGANRGELVGNLLARVVVVEERLNAAIAVAQSRIDLQVGAQGKLDVAAGTGVENVAEGGDEVKTVNAAGDVPQGFEVEVETKVLAQHLADVEV